MNWHEYVAKTGRVPAWPYEVNYGKENEELYLRTRLRPVAEAAPVLQAYVNPNFRYNRTAAVFSGATWIRRS